MMNWLQDIFGFFKSFQFWIVIAPWESALRVRLGKVAAVLRPGPHFRLPFLDRIFVQSVRLRTISDTGQTLTSKDGKVLTLSVAASYAIDDIRKLYMTVAQPELTLLLQIQGIIAEVVSQTISSEISPAKIEELVTQRMPSTDWGLAQVSVKVTSFAYVKTYRLLMNDYRNINVNNDLENQWGGATARVG